jgi:membrane protein YqaA with SNARE-associated domain
MIKILTVAAMASFEMYAAITFGFACHLNPWEIFFASLIGGLIGVFVAAYLGDKIKAFLSKYRKPAPEKPKTGFIYTLWNKYGVNGLGLIGTFFLGAPIAIAVGVGLKVPVEKLVRLCCIGVVVRCIIFTLIGHMGKQFFISVF